MFWCQDLSGCYAHHFGDVQTHRPSPYTHMSTFSSFIVATIGFPEIRLSYQTVYGIPCNLAHFILQNFKVIVNTSTTKLVSWVVTEMIL